MATVKEAWAKLTDTKQDSGVRGHELTGGLAHHGAAHDPMTCPHCADIRELMLAVHVDACESFVMETGKATLECGKDGWDCPKAKALKELGGKA